MIILAEKRWSRLFGNKTSGRWHDCAVETLPKNLNSYCVGQILEQIPSQEAVGPPGEHKIGSVKKVLVIERGVAEKTMTITAIDSYSYGCHQQALD